MQLWQQHLPGYIRCLEEWVQLDERGRAVDAILTIFLGSLRIHASQNVQVTREEMDTLWQELAASPLGSQQFLEILGKQRAGVALVREWDNYREFVETIEKVRRTVQGLN